MCETTFIEVSGAASGEKLVTDERVAAFAGTLAEYYDRCLVRASVIGRLTWRTSLLKCLARSTTL